MTHRLIGAACWASYLVNGDDSGLEPREKALANAWLEFNETQRRQIVDCNEPFFSWSYGFYTGDTVSGGDLVEYVVQ